MAIAEQAPHISYDKEKYRDILLEAAETVLGYFGFDRSMYGNPPKNKKKWWQRLNEEKLKDRNIETA
jgi:hypothetical protein